MNNENNFQLHSDELEIAYIPPNAIYEHKNR